MGPTASVNAFEALLLSGSLTWAGKAIPFTVLFWHHSLVPTIRPHLELSPSVKEDEWRGFLPPLSWTTPHPSRPRYSPTATGSSWPSSRRSPSPRWWSRGSWCARCLRRARAPTA
ncbi:hypothetical protein SGPA1_60171 [Streptomyces misionensis JCM 4497]